MRDDAASDRVLAKIEAVTESMAQMTAELRSGAIGTRTTSIMRMESGGMAIALAMSSAAIAIFAMVALVCVLVWTTSEIAGLKNHDAVQDAYQSQHGSRISALEAKAKGKSE